MKKFYWRILILFTMALTTANAQKPSGIDYENLDLTTTPGNDFAKYATGHWIDHNPQPPAYPAWGTTTKVYDNNLSMLAEMIQEIASKKHAKGSVAKKIADIYNGVMDTTRLDKEGATPLLKALKRIKKVKSREELLKRLAKVSHTGLLFDIGIGADDKDSKNNVVGISQGSLLMGDRDYYLKEDEKIKEIREAYIEHLQNLCILCGYDKATAREKVAIAMRIEKELAEVCYSKEQLRNPEANYHKMTLDELSMKTYNFNWKKFMYDMTFKETKEVVVGQPEPIALGCKMLMNLPLEELKTIVELRMIFGASSALSSKFDDENMEFKFKLTGAKQKQPRWKIAVGTVSSLMSDAVGEMFVQKYFSPEAKSEMLEMIHNLQTALGNRIKAQDWMSEETKKVAIDKLESFIVKVGYPDKWDDLSKLKVNPQKSLLENSAIIGEFYWKLNRDKKYNKPVDPTEWHMSAQTVNAYYNPSTNEICFPAGFLQKPLFDINADAASNYGSIGAVIGHEMTHGFDDQGRQYDKEGNLKQWWKEEDVEKFKIPTDQLVAHFDSLWVIPGELHANGKLCLGENIADHGGVNVAYDALQLWQEKHGKLPSENGFSPEQRFFLSFARVWAGSSSDEIKRYLTQMDVHSIDFLRVNGTLPHCDCWYKAFNIKPGDKLYIAPEKRVNIW